MFAPESSSIALSRFPSISVSARYKLVFLLLLSCSFLGCQAKVESVPPSASRSWGEPSNGLRSSIDTEETAWSRGNPALVSVLLENVSGSKVDLRTIPALRLNESEYWCPVDIEEEGQSLPANARSTISLEKGASVNVRIDLSKVGWDRGISSVWPAQNLYALVPPGVYRLRLDIEVIDGGGPKWIRSNQVQVAIRE